MKKTIFLTICLLLLAGAAHAQDKPDKNYEELKKRLEALEKKAAAADAANAPAAAPSAPGAQFPAYNRATVKPGAAPAPSVEELKMRLDEIEKKTLLLEGRAQQPGQDTISFQTSPLSSPGAQFPNYNRMSTTTGFSRFYNPAISVNGLYSGAYRSAENNNRNADPKTGLEAQEVELVATAMIDNYLRGNFVAAFSDDRFELEESYVDVLIGQDLSLRAGKWYSTFGKHNFFHTHQFPFIDAPLVNREIFGREALNESGLGLNYLAPAPWYSELILSVLDGKNERLLNGPLNNDLAYLAHSKNMWDLTPETTLELGGSYLYGKNEFGGQNGSSRAFGGNLTMKWVPARRARYNQIEWQTEFIKSIKEMGMDNGVNRPGEKKSGVYSYIKYQFAQNWWAQARYDYFGIERPEDTPLRQRWSGLVGYVPTEFSAVRLQYNYVTETGRDEHQVLLQLNYTMGSHPAHNY